MGISEVSVYRITCDRCRRDGGTVVAPHPPGRPQGWDYETLHDCGLTGYTTHRLLCENCLAEDRRRSEAASRDSQLSREEDR